MILYDAYLVQQDKKIELEEEQLKRRKEMNIEMTKKVKEFLYSANKIEKIQNESVLDAMKKGY